MAKEKQLRQPEWPVAAAMQSAADARARPAAEAPDHLFQHVEQSLDNGIRPNMLAEVLYTKNPNAYWIANITMVCGHLLRMRFIGSEEDNWYDMSKTTIYYLGWCARSQETIHPPEDIDKLYDNNNLVHILRSAIENQQSIPKEALDTRGSLPIDKIEPGMKVEVQNESHPYKYWIATILKNNGGRLLLRYDAPQDIENDQWLFYTSPRVAYLGFTQYSGNDYYLEHPKYEKYSKFSPAEWTACKNSSLKAGSISTYPESLFTVADVEESHSFRVGMKVEAVNPTTMSEICPATVTTVHDNHYFVVSLDNELDDSKARIWLCHFSHPYIFPVGWAQSSNIDICTQLLKKFNNNFTWKKYLDITKSTSAPSDCFDKRITAAKAGFKIGMKLEAADPLNPSNISVATIKNIAKHLLFITIDYTGNSHWFSHDSTDLYPSGWCSSNNMTLCTPETIKAQSENIEHIKLLQSYNVPAQIKEKWCDRVYFNYKCYAGPHISKNKLSHLPCHMGPGPLSLVIHKVLNMIISVAYKPASLLKEWEVEDVSSSVKYVTLKAKLKTNTHYGKVVTITSCEELTKYCKTMCEKLQACPYLFGTTEITANCPEQCSLVNKSKFRKKTRKKGLHFMTIRARERRAAMESENRSKEDSDDKNVESNESDHSRSSSPRVSDSGTRPNSRESNAFKPNRKRQSKPIVPPLEMKTRGAKLPNFAIQMKEGHWDRKEVDSLYNKPAPRKSYSDSESDNSSCNSIDSKNDGKISDVSDAEEPELKKLRVTPLNDESPTSIKLNDFGDSITSHRLERHQFESNVGGWTVNDVYNFLSKYDEFRQIAVRLKEEEFDGMALIMLNLPTMREHLKLKLEPALKLCKVVTDLKWAYFQYHFNVKT